MGQVAGQAVGPADAGAGGLQRQIGEVIAPHRPVVVAQQLRQAFAGLGHRFGIGASFGRQGVAHLQIDRQHRTVAAQDAVNAAGAHVARHAAAVAIAAAADRFAGQWHQAVEAITEADRAAFRIQHKHPLSRLGCDQIVNRAPVEPRENTRGIGGGRHLDFDATRQHRSLRQPQLLARPPLAIAEQFRRLQADRLLHRHHVQLQPAHLQGRVGGIAAPHPDPGEHPITIPLVSQRRWQVPDPEQVGIGGAEAVGGPGAQAWVALSGGGREAQAQAAAAAEGFGAVVHHLQRHVERPVDLGVLAPKATGGDLPLQRPTHRRGTGIGAAVMVGGAAEGRIHPYPHAEHLPSQGEA